VGRRRPACALRRRGQFRPDRDRHGPLPCRARARRARGETARGAIVVVGDADFATNLHLGVLGNRDLLLVAAELAVRPNAYTASRPPPVSLSTFSTLALTAREASMRALERRRSFRASLQARSALAMAPAQAARVTVRGTSTWPSSWRPGRVLSRSPSAGGRPPSTPRVLTPPLGARPRIALVRRAARHEFTPRDGTGAAGRRRPRSRGSRREVLGVVDDSRPKAYGSRLTQRSFGSIRRRRRSVALEVGRPTRRDGRLRATVGSVRCCSVGALLRGSSKKLRRGVDEAPMP
jgi:hypothetical protein